DRGGNRLFYGQKAELHGFWDDQLVVSVAGKDFQKLALVLKSKLSDEAWINAEKLKTKGDPKKWPEQWATDSVHAAREAYAGVSFEKEPAELNIRREIRSIPVRL